MFKQGHESHNYINFKRSDNRMIYTFDNGLRCFRMFDSDYNLKCAFVYLGRAKNGYKFCKVFKI